MNANCFGLLLASALVFSSTPRLLGANTESLPHSIDASNILRLQIQTGGGQIRVRGWNRRYIDIVGAKQAAGPRPFITQVGGELRLSPSDPDQNALYIDLYVPASLQVSITSSAADVFLHGINGPVSVDTAVGNIHLYENSGKIQAMSDSGEIRLRLAESQSTVEIRSQGSDIHVTLSSERFRIYAATGGTLFLNGQQHGAGLDARKEIVLNSGSGNFGSALRLVSDTGRIVIQAPSTDLATLGKPQMARAESVGNSHLPAEENLDVAAAANGGAEVNPPPSHPTGETKDAGGSGSGMPASKANYKMIGSTIDSGYAIRASVDYINFNISVRDRDNRSVANLHKEEFLVYEDGQQQQVQKLLTTEAPFSLLLLLDISGSTSGFINLMKEASINFLHRLKPQDQVAVAVFNSDIALLADFSAGRPEAGRAIRDIRSRGGTAFYDALDTSVHEYMAHVEGRKAIGVFTDGVDNRMEGRGFGSTRTFEQVLRGIQEVDTIIYPIFLDTEADSMVSVGGFSRILADILSGGTTRRSIRIRQGSKSEHHERARRELAMVAEQTGGRMYTPRKIENLEGVYAQIADDLRVQYTLSYASTNPARNGKWRRIQVRIQGHPEYLVRTRLGYYAPDDRRMETARR
ncbi:MAG: VWA domain-containing protein [Acidobacteria bacterium]|nr:VWA domain-containing protein [Acidobacteriota bacterium]